MRESYGEGVASHIGPESCGDDREVAVEALTGVRAGRVSSPERSNIGVPTRILWRGRQHRPGPLSEDRGGRRGIIDPVHVRKHPAERAYLSPRAGPLVWPGPEDRKPGGPRFGHAAGGVVRAVNPKGARRR